MATTRSTRLVSRVLRNLKRHGIDVSEILDEEIYDELTQGQNNIISDANPDKIVTVTLKEDVEYYPLTTDTVTDPSLTTYKNNISSVRLVKQPEDFTYPFLILNNKDFVECIDGVGISWTGILGLYTGIDFTSYIKTGIEMTGVKDGVNKTFLIPEDLVEDSEEIFFNGVLQVRDTDYSILNQTVTLLHDVIPLDIAHGGDYDDTLVCNYIKYTSLGSSIINTHQPLIATTIENKLRIYPIPDSTYEDVEIELYVHQKSSVADISASVLPELGDEWDKVLECFATAQFLSGKDRAGWLVEQSSELRRLRPQLHRKDSLTRPRVF